MILSAYKCIYKAAGQVKSSVVVDILAHITYRLNARQWGCEEE